MLGAFLLALLAGANSASVQAATSPTVPPALQPDQAITKIMPLPRDCDIKNRYYPVRAQRAGIDGNALLDCRVEPTGKLADCHVLRETPANFGFGDSALCMSVLFKSRTTGKSGASLVGTRVPVPVRFDLPR